MPYFEFSCEVPFDRPPVFDVVADVASYPEFVPGCRDARILRHTGEWLEVEQVMGLGAWSWRFRTEATLRRPERITITTRESPFDHLHQVWRFVDVPGRGTTVLLEVDYELRSPFLRRLVTRLFDEGFRRTLQAFERRIRDRLGRVPDAARR